MQYIACTYECGKCIFVIFHVYECGKCILSVYECGKCILHIYECGKCILHVYECGKCILSVYRCGKGTQFLDLEWINVDLTISTYSGICMNEGGQFLMLQSGKGDIWGSEMHYSNTYGSIPFLKSCAWNPLKPLHFSREPEIICFSQYVCLQVDQKQDNKKI